VVRSPVGQVSIDRTGKAAGRGAYVCRAAECIDNAIKKGALNRALNTSVPAELREALTAELADQPMTTTRGGARGQE
jgi:hypothetical protein